MDSNTPPYGEKLEMTSASQVKSSKTKKSSKKGFEPRILALCCNWCSYAGGDMAGTSRLQYPASVRLIRTMCSARVDESFIKRAFRKGAPVVLVSGCHFGDCHYIFGNERAVEQFEKTMNVVKLLGIEPGRLRLEWISAAEGTRFAEIINEFTDQVRELGPCPVAGKRRSISKKAE